jgi:Tol biopolymer transport system component
MPRWSPDNDEILFLAHDNAYAAPSLGGSPRIVARGTPGDGKIWSASWSPAGDSVVIVRNDSVLVQPRSGSGSRLVAVGKGRQLHSCVWSPRGAWIACVSGNALEIEPGPLFGNEATSAILLYPAAGGAPVDLTGNAFQHTHPAWSADGHHLWVLSDRDGEPGEVYSVRVGSDGRASEAFVRVGMNAESIDLAANRIAYSVPIRRANIWSVPVPGDRVLTLPTDGTQVTKGSQLIELTSVSPDGKWLVYDSNNKGNPDIYRVPISRDGTAGAAAEALTDDPRKEYAGAISPDGRELVWQRFVSGKRRLWMRRLDGDTGHEMLTAPGDQGVPRWSPDGRSIAAWSHDKEAGAVFVIHRDAEGSWKPWAWRLEGGQLPVWSPDGRSLAFVRYDGGVETIPVDSGARTMVYAPPKGAADPMATNLVWGGDPSIIWFIGIDRLGHGGIWSVSARGGPAQLRVNLDNPSGWLPGPGISSNGERFYFTLDERVSNVRWAELVKP